MATRPGKEGRRGVKSHGSGGIYSAISSACSEILQKSPPLLPDGSKMFASWQRKWLEDLIGIQGQNRLKINWFKELKERLEEEDFLLSVQYNIIIPLYSRGQDCCLPLLQYLYSSHGKAFAVVKRFVNPVNPSILVVERNNSGPYSLILYLYCENVRSLPNIMWLLQPRTFLAFPARTCVRLSKSSLCGVQLQNIL